GRYRMYSHNGVGLATVAVAGLVLAGCSGTLDGSAQPASPVRETLSQGQSADSSESREASDSESPSENLPSNGAPKVETPLDASGLKDNLCMAMNDKQAEQFPGEFAGAEITDEGYCVWKYYQDPFRLA